MRFLLVGLLLTGCTTTEETRICLDYKSIPLEREKCTPLYGNIICHNVVDIEVVCTQWMETNELLLRR